MKTFEEMNIVTVFRNLSSSYCKNRDKNQLQRQKCPMLCHWRRHKEGGDN